MKKREERFPSWPGEKPETHEERKSETGTPNNVSKTRQNLADMFVASLSQNQLPWNQPWVSSIPSMARLRNAVSEKPYQGVNKLFLWLTALNKHYEDPRWCTFRQATEKGWKIRKGEHGYPVEYWMMYDVIEKKYYSFDEAARIVHENEDKQGDFRTRCKTYVVFNAAQIEGIPELNASVALPSGPEYTNKVADEFFRTYLRNENIKLDTGASAYYTRGFDMIVLPPKKDFVSEEAYYDTAFHEAVHSTQGPDRTNRTVKYEEKSGRAMEELIAEIGCAFISLAVFGDVGSDVRENNIAYVQSWSEGIKKDPNTLARAIKLADEGANYVIEHGELERIILSHEADKLAERAIDIGEALYGADGALAVGDRQESAALQEELERLHGPSDIASSGDKPESTLDSFKEKTAAFAEKYKALSFNEKISVLATTFGCQSGTIKTSPCTGDWRGTSDVSLVFDNGNSYFLGNGLTPKVKTKNRQNEMLNTALELYNPETIELSKETALAALKQREVLDNMAGAKMGLKPYTVLNVEMRDASVPVHDIGSDHVGWYFVTLAIDGKIRAHLETNLSYGVKSGTTSTVPEREKYFPAGALHENDVDYLFNGVGFSSSSSLYTLQLTEKERMRAEKTLKEIRPEVDVQDEKEAGGLESFIAQYNAEHGGKENPENSRQEDIDR